MSWPPSWSDIEWLNQHQISKCKFHYTSKFTMSKIHVHFIFSKISDLTAKEILSFHSMKQDVMAKCCVNDINRCMHFILK